MIDVLAIAGSLRRGSYNRSLLRAAAGRAPAGLRIRAYDELAAVPMFDEDLELRPATETGAGAFRDAVESADALLIATPEYNWSIPGVLKNALDWLSRPLPSNVLQAKPIAIMGASGGRWGTRLAQAALRQVLTATESLVMPAPALFAGSARNAFDGEGRLVDAALASQLDEFLAAFERWVRAAAIPGAHRV